MDQSNNATSFLYLPIFSPKKSYFILLCSFLWTTLFLFFHLSTHEFAFPFSFLFVSKKNFHKKFKGNHKPPHTTPHCTHHHTHSEKQKKKIGNEIKNLIWKGEQNTFLFIQHNKWALWNLFLCCVVGPRGGGGSRETLFYPHSNPQQHQIEGGSIILRKRKEEKRKEEKRWKKEKGKKKKGRKKMKERKRKKKRRGNKKSFIWQHKRENKAGCVYCVLYM